VWRSFGMRADEVDRGCDLAGCAEKRNNLIFVVKLQSEKVRPGARENKRILEELIGVFPRLREGKRHQEVDAGG